jgi:hypothetical protein
MSTNDEIKSQLFFISNKIDEAIKQYRETKSQEIQTKQYEDIPLDYSNNIGKINVFKSLIESLQKSLEEDYNIDKVNQLESDIKKKEKTIKDLNGEIKLLNFAIKEQNKGINEFLSKFDSTKEQNELNDKLKIMKKDNHSHKELFKNLSNLIKIQKTKIDSLEKKSNLIKQNIDFQKKKQMKEVEKKLKMDKKDNMEVGEVEDEYENFDLDKMEEFENNLINEINLEEKCFRTKINEQNDIIKAINSNITKIEGSIKDLIQEEKLEKIKSKKRGKSITKYSNISKNTQNKEFKRKTSYYKPKNNQNNSNNKITNYTNKTKNKNFGIGGFEKITKPFEIKKFNDLSNNINNNEEKNYTIFNENNKKMKFPPFNDKYIDYESINLQKKKNKTSSAIQEIESLKNEIQNALKNNIVILGDNEELIHDEIYIKNNDDKISNSEFSGTKTGRFGEVERKEDDKILYEKDENILGYDYMDENNKQKKNLIQNEKRVKDYQPIKYEKSEEIRRKPFDKIIFK